MRREDTKTVISMDVLYEETKEVFHNIEWLRKIPSNLPYALGKAVKKHIVNCCYSYGEFKLPNASVAPIADVCEQMLHTENRKKFLEENPDCDICQLLYLLGTELDLVTRVRKLNELEIREWKFERKQ